MCIIILEVIYRVYKRTVMRRHQERSKGECEKGKKKGGTGKD